jgi:hypothetical protein
MSDAGKIHLTDAPPSACASCYGQYVDRPHVDFGAAYDGPTVYGDTGVALEKKVAIDDLIICEECLGAAAALLGFRDEADTQAEMDNLKAQLTDLRERMAGALAYIRKADEEVQARADLELALKPAKAKAKA